jgi:peptidase E
MIILTSDGLSSDALLFETELYIRPQAKVIFITTASGIGSRDHSLLTVKKELARLGAISFKSDSLSRRKKLDFLLEYDVIELLGGNPFWLLKRLQELNFSHILEKILKKDILLIGYSAGSIVLQNNLRLIARLKEDEGDMNADIHLRDINGYKLIDASIVPHWQYLSKNYPHYRRIVSYYERKENEPVIRLNDGEGIFVKGRNDYYLIKGKSRNN